MTDDLYVLGVKKTQSRDRFLQLGSDLLLFILHISFATPLTTSSTTPLATVSNSSAIIIEEMLARLPLFVIYFFRLKSGTEDRYVIDWSSPCLARLLSKRYNYRPEFLAQGTQIFGLRLLIRRVPLTQSPATQHRYQNMQSMHPRLGLKVAVILISFIT